MSEHRLLSKADIEYALRALAAALTTAGDASVFEILVVGGAAMALAYDSRRTTNDVDIVVTSGSPERIAAAARGVASKLSLAPGWLSEDVKRFVVRVETGEVALSTPTLQVRVAPAEQLLAMKLAAWRDEVDISDAKHLLRLLPGDMESVWSRVGGFVEGASRAQARYNFEDLWEAERGAS